VSVVSESLATVGVILVLAGSGVAIGQHWLLVTDWGRVGILAGVASSLLLAGFVVRWLTSSATEPLTELMWCASAACAAGAAAIMAAGIYGLPAAVTVVIVGGTVAIYSAALWLMCRREALMGAMFAGSIAALCGALPVAVADAGPWLTLGLGLWLLGMAWTVLGWVYPEPLGTSISVGAAIALAGPAIAGYEKPWVYLIGIGTAAAVMAAGVPLRNVVLVTFGSGALFGYITAVILRYAHWSLGVPASLVIIGLVLITLAVATMRLGRVSRPRSLRPPKPGRDHKPAGPAGRPRTRAA
jgi:hypothetical protein